MNRLLCCALALALSVLGGCAISGGGVHVNRWDSMLGTDKDTRVKELGVPLRCHTFKNGGELCEWNYVLEGGKTEPVWLQFDQKGIVCQWTYRGFYGQETSMAKC